jgi:hypothetical protein
MVNFFTAGFADLAADLTVTASHADERQWF